MRPYSMSRIRWKCWKCYLIWGSKKYGSWWFSKNKKKPYSGNFVPTFLNVNRVLLFVQDRHSPWLEAAESPPVLLWSAPKCFFCKTFWRREISAQTSNKWRSPGLSILQLSANTNFEVEPSLWVIQNTFPKRFWKCFVKNSKMVLQRQKTKMREGELKR